MHRSAPNQPNSRFNQAPQLTPRIIRLGPLPLHPNFWRLTLRPPESKTEQEQSKSRVPGFQAPTFAIPSSAAITSSTPTFAFHLSRTKDTQAQGTGRHTASLRRDAFFPASSIFTSVRLPRPSALTHSLTRLALLAQHLLDKLQTPSSTTQYLILKYTVYILDLEVCHSKRSSEGAADKAATIHLLKPDPSRKHEHPPSPKRQAIPSNATESIPTKIKWSQRFRLQSVLFTIFKYFYKFTPEPYH